jgi:two-component system, sensor histidine kinase
VTAEATNPTVLYVDDDPINLRVVSDLLGACGMTVVCAVGGEEALQTLMNQTFDAVLMDIHMPVMNGIATLQEIRKLGGDTSRVPVIALTADVSRSEADYLELGFNGFVAKPVALKPLLGTLLKALSTNKAGFPQLRRLA